MSRHRARPARRRLSRVALPLVALALVAVTVVLLGVGSRGSLALFRDTATVTAGAAATPDTAFTSGSVAKPALASTAQTPVTDAVTLTWSATPVGTLGATASAYEVFRYAAATGGTGTSVCTTTGALSCVDAGAPQVPVWYQLRAKFATSWDQDGDRVAYTPDVTAPVLVISRPTNGYANTAANLRTHVSGGCASGVACGTATDPSTTTVTYRLTRVRSFGVLGSQTACWDDTTWQTGSCTADRAATLSGTTWTVPGTTAAAYPSGGLLVSGNAFTLVVTATDGFGNVATQTVTYSGSP